MKNSYSPFYASVEQLELKDAHPSYDIWSIGIIAYKLMAKNEPYMDQSDVKRIKNIKEENRDKLPECYSQPLRDLVDYLLTVDQDKRPTIEQVLR